MSEFLKNDTHTSRRKEKDCGSVLCYIYSSSGIRIAEKRHFHYVDKY